MRRFLPAHPPGPLVRVEPMPDPFGRPALHRRARCHSPVGSQCPGAPREARTCARSRVRPGPPDARLREPPTRSAGSSPAALPARAGRPHHGPRGRPSGTPLIARASDTKERSCASVSSWREALPARPGRWRISGGWVTTPWAAATRWRWWTCSRTRSGRTRTGAPAGRRGQGGERGGPGKHLSGAAPQEAEGGGRVVGVSGASPESRRGRREGPTCTGR